MGLDRCMYKFRKFTTVSYRTSAIWGHCPKRSERNLAHSQRNLNDIFGAPYVSATRELALEEQKHLGSGRDALWGGN